MYSVHPTIITLSLNRCIVNIFAFIVPLLIPIALGRFSHHGFEISRSAMDLSASGVANATAAGNLNEAQ